MKIRDEKQTNQLLQGLDNVDIENVDRYLQEKGVIVDISVGRKRIPIKIKKEMFGIDDENEEVNDFMNNYVKQGNLMFLSNATVKRLQAIESYVRTERNAKAIGYDNKYMTIESYKSFKAFFEEKKADYFEVLNSIIRGWDNQIIDFRKKMQSTFNALNSFEKDRLIEYVIAKIPSKTEYEDSFYMNIKLKAFPTMTNVSLFDRDIAENIKDSMRQEVMGSIYDMIKTVLSRCFKEINIIYKYYDSHDTLMSSHIAKFKKIESDLKKNNIINNKHITDIINKLILINKSNNIEDKMEMIDEVLGLIYGYCLELDILEGLDLDKSILPEDVLLTIFKSLT